MVFTSDVKYYEMWSIIPLHAYYMSKHFSFQSPELLQLLTSSETRFEWFFTKLHSF